VHKNPRCGFLPTSSGGVRRNLWDSAGLCAIQTFGRSSGVGSRLARYSEGQAYLFAPHFRIAGFERMRTLHQRTVKAQYRKLCCGGIRTDAVSRLRKAI
jgi:hypothetical protein